MTTSDVCLTLFCLDCADQVFIVDKPEVLIHCDRVNGYGGDLVLTDCAICKEQFRVEQWVVAMSSLGEDGEIQTVLAHRDCAKNRPNQADSRGESSL